MQLKWKTFAYTPSKANKTTTREKYSVTYSWWGVGKVLFLKGYRIRSVEPKLSRIDQLNT